MESDSKSSVDWISKKAQAPWSAFTTISHIWGIQEKLKGFKISHIFREGTRVTDTIAAFNANSGIVNKISIHPDLKGFGNVLCDILKEDCQGTTYTRVNHDVTISLN